MKTFTEYIELKEEEEFDAQLLNEDPLTMAGIILGYGAAGILIGFGGALLITGYTKLAAKLIQTIRRFYKRYDKVDIEPRDINSKMKDLKVKPAVRMQTNRLKEERNKNEEAFKAVFAAIKDKEPMAVKEALKTIKKNQKLINRMVIYETTKVFGEPPLHFGNTGNNSYLFIKRTLSIKVARAASIAVKKAFEENFTDIFSHSLFLFKACACVTFSFPTKNIELVNLNKLSIHSIFAECVK